jgi:hypothetical protein
MTQMARLHASIGRGILKCLISTMAPYCRQDQQQKDLVRRSNARALPTTRFVAALLLWRRSGRTRDGAYGGTVKTLLSPY